MICLHAEQPIVLHQSSKLGTCNLVLSEQGVMNMLLEASILLVMLCFHLSCISSVSFELSLHFEDRRRCGDSHK